MIINKIIVKRSLEIRNRKRGNEESGKEDMRQQMLLILLIIRSLMPLLTYPMPLLRLHSSRLAAFRRGDDRSWRQLHGLIFDTTERAKIALL